MLARDGKVKHDVFAILRIDILIIFTLTPTTTCRIKTPLLLLSPFFVSIIMYKSKRSGGLLAWCQAMAPVLAMAHHSVVGAKASRLWLTIPLNSGDIPNLVPNSIFLTFFSMARAYGTTTPSALKMIVIRAHHPPGITINPEEQQHTMSLNLSHALSIASPRHHHPLISTYKLTRPYNVSFNPSVRLLKQLPSLKTPTNTADGIFRAEPWTVPWTAKTILQVMLLWIASFWLVGSWVIPFVAHTAGFRKETLTYRGQALYSLLTDVVEGVAGIAILKLCLSRFRPLSADWFKFSFKGNWYLDVGLGCFMFPLVNRLSQVNLNLLPLPPPAPVAISNVEQSIVARDPMAMVLYAIVVSVCAPIWEEIVFRGFLLPSLTRYMPVWCAILVSSLAFALAHFNMQRLLPLVFLGVVMGTVFARSRNLLPSMLLHSLWNAFVFVDLMR
ncbi:CAAX amino terminal protease [Tanacetum coccineum]|uniref:CAAX amino terminal protease n=1 Tax=Tanacetum coccineum TaxID=301880 RepID=A0ABQ5I1D9_9ASTR